MKNFKLEPVNIKYNINEEKKVVTCIATYSLGNIVYNAQSRYNVDKTLKLLSSNNNISRPSYEKIAVVGIAKCSPEDIFDIELGKKIAESRASIKAFKFYSEYLRQCSLDVNKFYNYLDNLSDKYKTIATKEEGHLKFLLGK